MKLPSLLPLVKLALDSGTKPVPFHPLGGSVEVIEELMINELSDFRKVLARGSRLRSFDSEYPRDLSECWGHAAR